MIAIQEVAAQLVTVALLVECATELIKNFIPKELTTYQKQLISLVLALIMSVTMQVSIFKGSPSVVGMGMVVAGMIASRGSNYTHDIIGVFEKLGDALKQKASS